MPDRELRASWPAVAFILLAIASLPFVVSGEVAQVIAPIAASGFVSLAFFWTLWRRRHGRVPWFEIGSVYVLVIVVYLAYPLIGFLALGQHYSVYNDGRLSFEPPSAAEVGAAGWLYVWHLLGFVLAYIAMRGRLRMREVSLPRPGSHLVLAVVAMLLLIEAYEWVVISYYDLSASTYMETYLVVRQLPLVLAQLLNHLHGIRYVLSVMLMAALFTRYPRSRPLLAIWLLIEAASTVMRLGSRMELMLLVLAATMMYDALVRPLSTRLVVTVGTLGLVGFVAFGIARYIAAGVEVHSYNPFAYSSEFESLFANVIHLSRIQSTIHDLPASFFLADLAALIPQQFAPFTKVSPADWYVSTYFSGYADKGGGLAFGTLAEAVLLGGWIGALLRGAALGLCFAAIHRLYVRKGDSFWVFVFYIWVATLSYQSFRNTTFYLLVLAAFRFVPALVAVNILAAALRRAPAARALFAARAVLKA